jgi:hypothetical protein
VRFQLGRQLLRRRQLGRQLLRRWHLSASCSGSSSL